MHVGPKIRVPPSRLQWGRGRATAECCERCRLSPRYVNFNGAAVARPRNGAHLVLITNPPFSLQWGRGRATAEWGRLGPSRPLRQSTSMGPRSRDRGMVTTPKTANHADVTSMGPRSREPRNVINTEHAIHIVVVDTSMGPRSRDRGMGYLPLSIGEHMPSFNGAAVARPRNELAL